jgi:hypothetical protein
VSHGPQQNLARLGGLLEPCGDVDGIPGREGLALGRVARNHLACVDARAHGDREAPLALELLVERSEAVTHLRGSSDGAQSVVLVHGRYSEDGHDGIADELLHGAAMFFEDSSHLLEVALHDSAHRLGIRLLTERG